MCAVGTAEENINSMSECPNNYIDNINYDNERYCNKVVAPQKSAKFKRVGYYTYETWVGIFFTTRDNW